MCTSSNLLFFRVVYKQCEVVKQEEGERFKPS